MTITTEISNYDTGAVVQFTAGILINKLDRESLNSLIKNLKKFFLKKNKSLEFNVKEVNTFLFISALLDFDLVSTMEQRRVLEDELRDIIIDYSLKESNDFSKKIARNVEIKDISHILFDLIASSKSPDEGNLVTEVKRRAKEIQHRSMVHVTDVHLNSFVMSWEFSKSHADIIVLPNNYHIKIENKTDLTIFQVQTLIENLSIMQFASVCLKNLNWLIGSFEYSIDNLRLLLKGAKEEIFLKTDITKPLWRALRVMFGLLSTTQQVLSDLLKQVNRIAEIKEELKNQIKKLDFKELLELFSLYNLDSECSDYVVWLNQLQQDTKLIYRDILELINRCKVKDDKTSGDVTDLIKSFSWALADIQTMKFFSEKFRDITFFQPIPPEVVVETKREIRLPEDVVVSGIALFKTYRLFGSTVYALRGVDITVKKGEMVAILGASGSGKTTLLNLLAGLDTPDNGAVFFKGKNIHMLSDSALSMYRRKEMGFIFQYYNLIPQLTVLENVMLPGIMAGNPQRKVRKKALNLLKEVGIERFKNQFPIKLSGGQMQRVTIARSMINDPVLLFADEPTGDLDSETGKVVVDLIHRFAKEKGTALIFVTHDKEMAKRCDRIIRIRDGRIVN
ncbi:MAG: ABC transporter ATP-binding protein [Candidatus Heimdallarchaeaceae archaeon]